MSSNTLNNSALIQANKMSQKVIMEESGDQMLSSMVPGDAMALVSENEDLKH
jgi:hypothetical protein